MKTMTCKQLGGACDNTFTANTFDEVAELSKNHCMEMYQAQDAEHMEAMAKMGKLCKSPKVISAWMRDRRAAFDALAEE
jgi:hypothetical protein